MRQQGVKRCEDRARGQPLGAAVIEPQLPTELRDQLAALALGEAADRLRWRDPALGQDLVGLHAPVFRDGEDHVERLRGHDVLRRVEEQGLDLRLARLEVALQLRPFWPYLVGPAKSPQSLLVASLGN